MYISRIKLYNWKNFHDCDVTLSERCFIIGANATGKSNFLDAIRFLRDIVKQGGGLQSAVDQRGGISKIRSLSARNRTDVCVEIELTENGSSQPKWLYSLDLINSGGGIKKQTVLVSKEYVYNYSTQQEVLNRTASSQGEDSETQQYTHIEQPTANLAFREIKDAFLTTEYLNVIPQFVRASDSVVLSLGKEDYYGRNFLSRLALLNGKTRDKYLRIISEVLADAVPQLVNLTFSKDSKGTPHIEATYRHWRARGSKQNEQMFSDGTIRLIGFLFAMLDGTGIILLEEPETNLHNAIVSAIPEFISRVQRSKGRQVIVTTHSYEILSNNGIRSDELIILKPTEGGTQAYNANEIDAVKTMMEAGLTAADAASPETDVMSASNISNVRL